LKMNFRHFLNRRRSSLQKGNDTIFFFKRFLETLDLHRSIFTLRSALHFFFQKKSLISSFRFHIEETEE
jgi:hypothetical protein